MEPDLFDRIMGDTRAMATIISGFVGFLGVIAALVINAWLGRIRQKEHWGNEREQAELERTNERSALAAALSAEVGQTAYFMNDINVRLNELEHKSTQEPVSYISPADLTFIGFQISDTFFKANADKIGVLGSTLTYHVSLAHSSFSVWSKLGQVNIEDLPKLAAQSASDYSIVHSTVEMLILVSDGCAPNDAYEKVLGS